MKNNEVNKESKVESSVTDYLEDNIVSNQTYGVFYRPFLVETKSKFIKELGTFYRSHMFCKGTIELILSRIHAICVSAPR